jgi:hypothetical protein
MRRSGIALIILLLCELKGGEDLIEDLIILIGFGAV